ncbi:hypothetical protein [Oerskovia sp. KBS0722]|uniref:hypothetical protein n=1 Tax=Oerskovia sp. KBS0722 TaxID=1179673 RepID=UPI00110DE33D|nr:hypothetical protein [Oerskovia sp. KBS0722]QDW63359.1 hypothetical protein FFI11_013320 [Oerskovia sp. KBS0722]
MNPAVKLDTRPSGWTVTTGEYVLAVRRDGARAALSRPDGRTWSDLSLVASVHRIGVADETYGTPEVSVRATPDGVTFRLVQASAAWRRKEVVLEARPDAVHVSVTVEGDGAIDTVTLAGGDAVTATGACGRFRSSIGFRSVFTPGPTEPVQVVRPATSAVVLGIVGDAEPGRLHGIFSPPPLALAFSHAPAPSEGEAAGGATSVPDGEWLGLVVRTAVADATFTRVAYEPLDGGWNLRLDYEGHTHVVGRWASPVVRLVPVLTPWAAIVDDREQVLGTTTSLERPRPAWWDQPIFCGWGSQCALAAANAASADPGLVGGAAATHAPSLSRQEHYDRWLDRLAEHDVVPGTVVIDDRWQAAYGTFTVDTTKWPDLKDWIARRHRAGQRVLLWFKAWDPEGLPADECVLDPSGRPVSVDPSNPAYLERLAAVVTHLVSPQGLDADGFKVDFTQRAPSGRNLTSAGDRAQGGGPWGISALHALMRTVHVAAKAAKPDALVVNHTVNPLFADVTDMVRLNDVLERDPSGAKVPVVDQLRFRAAVAHAALPGLPVDTDQWPMPDRDGWRAYVETQGSLGVPALYYVDAIDGSGEPLGDEDLALVARSWRTYRAGLA